MINQSKKRLVLLACLVGISTSFPVHASISRRNGSLVLVAAVIGGLYYYKYYYLPEKQKESNAEQKDAAQQKVDDMKPKTMSA